MQSWRALAAYADEDMELGAWPELIDQRLIGREMAGDRCEDEEPDDQDCAIDDEPHDSLDEDGY